MFNGLLPAALFTHHQGLSGGRGLSPRLWAHVLGQASSPDGFSNAYVAGDDFLSFGGTVTSNVGTYSGGYKSYEDTGDSISQIATDVGGHIVLTTDATDNDEVWMQSGYSTGVLGKIASSSAKKLVFEARVKVSKITNTGNMFVGLAQEGLAAADTISDSGVIADKDYIGFAILEDDGDALKFVYKKEGQTAQTVLTYGTAIAADTYYKLGFVFDPDEVPSKRIKIFVDNVEQSTYVTQTNIAAATFPAGEELAFLAGVKNGSGAIHALTMDWWNFYQAG